MNCVIKNETKHKEYDEYFPLIEEYFKKTLKHLKKEGNYVISLILVGPIKIKRINRDYRHIDKVTDVISFALMDTEDDYILPTDEIELGDIFINANRIKSQAFDYGHSEKREFIFLFVHGLLHCLGYDHMEEDDEKVMIALQKEILGDLR